MEWFHNLFFGNSSFWGGGVAHSVLILALVIALGIALGKLKIGGIRLGVTWILFVGIAFSHFGMQLNEHLVHFVKEFGLILFVYSIGLQVGPSFFSSFKKGGVKLNMLATAIVFLGVIAAYIVHLATGLHITTVVGILSGAVTNTPGLGAAQQAYADMTGIDAPDIATGYAVAYPLFGRSQKPVSRRQNRSADQTPDKPSVRHLARAPVRRAYRDRQRADSAPRRRQGNGRHDGR